MNYSDSPYKDLVERVRQAGELLLSYWPGHASSSNDTLSKEKKSDGSLVTSADYASNELLVSALSELFPKDGILSEEVPISSDLDKHKRLWIVDPLDGTQRFADGAADFSILVGLTENHQSKFGIMFFPALNILALGDVENGVGVNGAQVQVSEFSSIRPESVYIRRFVCENESLVYPQKMDSGMALLALAQGRLDGLIIKLSHHRQWDLAAPSVIIEQAGGLITDEFGNVIEYRPDNFNYGYFVASNGKVHEELLALIPKDS